MSLNPFLIKSLILTAIKSRRKIIEEICLNPFLIESLILTRIHIIEKEEDKKASQSFFNQVTYSNFVGFGFLPVNSAKSQSFFNQVTYSNLGDEFWNNITFDVSILF